MSIMKDMYKNTPLKIFLADIIRQCHLWGHECDTLKMTARLSDTQFITQLLNRRGFICTCNTFNMIHFLWFSCAFGENSKPGDSQSHELKMNTVKLIYNRINGRRAWLIHDAITSAFIHLACHLWDEKTADTNVYHNNRMIEPDTRFFYQISFRKRGIRK